MVYGLKVIVNNVAVTTVYQYYYAIVYKSLVLDTRQ